MVRDRRQERRMATVPTASADPLDKRVPALHSGDRLSRVEFHRRYLAYPEDAKFELIGGIVFMASPVRRTHGLYHVELSALLKAYVSHTPGTETADNATVILDDDNEPQPDLYLRILENAGGQSGTSEDDYVLGPPELIAEIAYSSVAIDLHAKKDRYQHAGVVEYLVLCIEERELRWFDLANSRSLSSDSRGVFRSQTLSGLWIDGPALLARDTQQLLSVLNQGLATPEHARFLHQ
jgi:Uma2 family endonuclease